MAADLARAHRLLLRRGDPMAPYLLWVMLNPSTADDTVDDPTIRRVRGFTEANWFQAFRVVNLYSLRATKPADLWATPATERNHPDADEVIRQAAAGATSVVCAWGAHGERCPERIQTVVGLLRDAGYHDLYRIGPPTKAGQPRHPLYLPASARPELIDDVRDLY